MRLCNWAVGLKSSEAGTRGLGREAETEAWKAPAPAPATSVQPTALFSKYASTLANKYDVNFEDEVGNLISAL